MSYTLFGRVEYFEGKNVKINTMFDEKSVGSYAVIKNLTTIKKGFHPLRKNGFMIITNRRTAMYDPLLTRDIKSLHGKDVSIECEIKEYTFTSKGETLTGWKLLAHSIMVRDEK